MPLCVLHVVGRNFEPGPYLATASLEPYSVFRRGNRMFPASPRSRKVHEVGGFQCEVSPGGTLLAQVNDATAFLRRHRGDLLRLASLPEIDFKYLDFGHEVRLDGERVCVQCDYLPAEFLRLVGRLGLGIELSLYLPPQKGT